MRATSDSLDLYTVWKRDEELHQRLGSPTAPANPIPFKPDASKYLVPTFSPVFYTDGYSSMKEDDHYERTVYDEEMEVPSIGTDRKNFDVAEMITFDIPGASTCLPLMCKMIIYKQGATHEREPPVLVRDVCVQWDGVGRLRSNSTDGLTWSSASDVDHGLQRARSSEHLLNSSGNTSSSRWGTLRDNRRSVSVTSSLADDDDASSTVTAGGTIRHRVSHLLHRHKYQRQIDTSILGRSEFYSVPFYQYRGRRYGPQHVALQVSESDLAVEPNASDTLPYSVTIIIPVHDKETRPWMNLEIFQVSVPIDYTSKHTTIGYVNTTPYITVQRTLHGQAIDV